MKWSLPLDDDDDMNYYFKLFVSQFVMINILLDINIR